jgi:mannose-6-phosphate isomerase-like protein (cupin superfamily)
MAGYSTVNLKEVENQGVNFGLDENDLELRMARVPLDCQNAGISLLRLAPGFRAPHGHRHKQQEEVYILVSGSARMKIDDDVVEMRPFTAVRVHPESMRCYEGGPEGGELIAIGAPNTGPGDGEIVAGWWSD